MAGVAPEAFSQFLFLFKQAPTGKFLLLLLSSLFIFHLFFVFVYLSMVPVLLSDDGGVAVADKLAEDLGAGEVERRVS